MCLHIPPYSEAIAKHGVPPSWADTAQFQPYVEAMRIRQHAAGCGQAEGALRLEAPSTTDRPFGSPQGPPTALHIRAYCSNGSIAIWPSPSLLWKTHDDLESPYLLLCTWPSTCYSLGLAWLCFPMF